MLHGCAASAILIGPCTASAARQGLSPAQLPLRGPFKTQPGSIRAVGSYGKAQTRRAEAKAPGVGRITQKQCSIQVALRSGLIK